MVHARMNIDIPDQTGKLVVVTGANSGIGAETSRRLAAAGAHVVLAVRDEDKGRRTAAIISARHPAAHVRVEALDLANLASVNAFAARMIQRATPIDILINNAGIMAVPVRHLTIDGFELQFGTNHLGHFALTAHLSPALRRAGSARVVTVSSLANHQGRIDVDNLKSERRYGPWRAYSTSKLANLIFAIRLQRLSERHGWGITSIAAHPGFTRTNLQHAGPNLGRTTSRVGLVDLMMKVPGIWQLPEQGALPSLYAATSPLAEGGGYYGPNGRGEATGVPAPAKKPALAEEEGTAAGLWAASERLVGISFTAGVTPLRERTPTTMNVHIRVCGANYSLRRAAAELADEIRRSFGFDIPLETGYHGQYDVFVDGEVLTPPGFAGGRRPSTDQFRRYVLAELGKRSQAHPDYQS